MPTKSEKTENGKTSKSSITMKLTKLKLVTAGHGKSTPTGDRALIQSSVPPVQDSI